MLFLLKGLILGFSIAAPVGPIGILCIRRTLAEGRLLGFISGLGAATADMFYGSVAAFGLTFISAVLIDHATLIRLIGGSFLVYLGISIIRATPSTETAKTSEELSGLWGAYGSTLFLTITNPMTILSFTAIFAGLGIADSSYTEAGILVLGVFIGSASWWLLLSGAVSILRDKFTPYRMRWVNRLSGAIITTFGLWQLASLL